VTSSEYLSTYFERKSFGCSNGGSQIPATKGVAQHHDVLGFYSGVDTVGVVQNASFN